MELRLQVQASEVALKEVQHVHLELRFGSLKKLSEAESARQLDKLDHFSRVVDAIDHCRVAQVAEVDNLAERLIVHLLAKVNDDFGLPILFFTLAEAFKELLTQQLTAASDDGHVALDLDTTDSAAFGTPELVYLLHLLPSLLVVVASTAALRRVATGVRVTRWV